MDSKTKKTLWLAVKPIDECNEQNEDFSIAGRL